VVVLNPRDEQRHLSVPVPDTRVSRWRDVLGGGTHDADAGTIRIVTVPACATLVLVPEGGP
jgi:hypothetical protein